MLSQRGGARTDTVVKLVLIFFVSLLSFSVGTFVGKQVSDSDYKRLALEDEYKNNGSGHETAENEAHGDNPAVSEEEVSSLTDEFVKNEKAEAKEEAEGHADREVASDDHAKQDDHGYKKVGGKKEEKSMKAAATKEMAKAHAAPAEEHGAPAAHKDPHAAAPANKEAKDAHGAAAPAHAAKADAAMDAAKRVAEGKSATKSEPIPRKPNSVLPSVATSAIGKYTIQVASFASEEEAKSNAAELKEKGWNAFYVPADVKGKTWFRVSVGLFSDMKSATTFRQKFLTETNISNAIVSKIVQ